MRLRVQGRFAAFRSSLPGERQDVHYELVDDAAITELADVQWADWDVKGRLLVATVVGMVANPHIQPWGRSPALINTGFAVVCVIYLVTVVVHGRRRDSFRAVTR